MQHLKQKLGEAIKRFRKHASLSQEQLADLASLHRTYIGSVERGERNISLENIVQIARALGIKPSDLLKDIE
jgi:transcriptional regulator with XRE-family HTH domain